MEFAEAYQKGPPAERSESQAVARRNDFGIKSDRRSEKAAGENRIIVYIDESGFYLLPLVSRTWAPKGQTPVIAEKAGKEHLNGPPQRFNCGHDAQRQAIHQRTGQGI